MFPYEVTASQTGPPFGTVGLTSLKVGDSGKGPSAKIFIELGGNLEISGQKVPINQKAYLTVSTTEWGDFWRIWALQPYSRPDRTILAFSLDGTGIEITDNGSPTLQSPRGVEILFAVEVTQGQLGMRANIDTDHWKTVFDFALQGIFSGHKQAVGWVFGNLGLNAGAIIEAACKIVK